MDLKKLQEIGGIVTEKPVDRKVAWRRLDDEGNFVDAEFVVQVLVLPYGQVEDMMKNGTATTPHFIAAAIRLNNGKESLTLEQARSLNPLLVREFARIINEVNGLEVRGGK